MNYIIRPIEPKDAEGLNALRRMPGVFENTLGLPSDRVSRSLEFINSLGPDQHEFVAVLTGEEELVIGMACLSVYHAPRMRHRGSIALMVRRDYQGQGVGKKLLSAVLDVADNWLMLTRTDLEVLEDNHKAIALYEKMGFEKEGLRRLSTIRNGIYVDEYIMGRLHPDYTQEEKTEDNESHGAL